MQNYSNFKICEIQLKCGLYHIIFGYIGGQGFKVSELCTEKSMLYCFSTILHGCWQINWLHENDLFLKFWITSKLSMLGSILTQFWLAYVKIQKILILEHPQYHAVWYMKWDHEFSEGRPRELSTELSRWQHPVKCIKYPNLFLILFFIVALD